MLEVKNLDAFYGAVQVLHGVNIVVNTGEIVGLVGANAAGKSSLMFSLAGLRTTCRGEVLLDGASIREFAPWERPSKGLVLVPERRRLFPFMSVLENLEIGAYAPAARAVISQSLEAVFALLPTLYERRGQVAGSMSGGEQQMLAIGRALMARPQVLLLDEPTEGLAPIYREASVRPDRRSARPGSHYPDRRTERPPRASDGGPRLCARKRPDRHGGKGACTP